MKFTKNLILLLLIAPVALYSQESLDCAGCHQNKEMKPSLKNSLGIPVSLYISPEKFQQSWHYTLGKKHECIECHKGITTYPHKNATVLSCFECHEKERNDLFRDIERSLQQSVHKDLQCYECHDVHQDRSPKQMELTERNEQCLKCHQFGVNPKDNKYLAPVHIEVYHTWHAQAQLHLAKIPCIACHIQLNPDRYAARHLIPEKEKSVKECSECHSRENKMATFLIQDEAESDRATAETMLSRIYLVGGTRNSIVEIFGTLLMVFAFLGASGHGILRIIIGKKKGKGKKK